MWSIRWSYHLEINFQGEGSDVRQFPPAICGINPNKMQTSLTFKGSEDVRSYYRKYSFYAGDPAF